MKTVVGILNSQAEAARAVETLRKAGIRKDRLSVLTPDASGRERDQVPTTETEQPGMGAAMGGVVGGALGAAGGMALGASAASLLVPGVGAVIAIGLAGAALLAAGGAVGGAIAGEALEDSIARGLPIDELFVYEDALKQGRSVLIVFADTDSEAERVREILREAGAESVDAARENWWVGLRDVEETNYSKDFDDFEQEESSYRRGFEAALHPELRGKPYEEVAGHLSADFPDQYAEDSFRRGYQRGQDHHRNLVATQEKAERHRAR